MEYINLHQEPLILFSNTLIRSHASVGLDPIPTCTKSMELQILMQLELLQSKVGIITPSCSVPLLSEFLRIVELRASDSDALSY